MVGGMFFKTNQNTREKHLFASPITAFIRIVLNTMYIKWHRVYLQMLYKAKWKLTILQMKICSLYPTKWFTMIFMSCISGIAL